MGTIIRMDSKKFMKELIPNENHEDFQFVLVSDFIETRNEFKNVKSLQYLMPPAEVLKDYANGDKKSYKQAYMHHLKTPMMDASIAIIVKAAVSENMKIVLLCSKSEDEFGYLKMLCEYIEASYQVKTHTWKEYKKNPDKATIGEDIKSIEKALNKKLDKLKNQGVEFVEAPSEDQLTERLLTLDKKALKEIIKARKLKVDKDLGRKKMAKAIAKAIAKKDKKKTK